MFLSAVTVVIAITTQLRTGNERINMHDELRVFGR
jgi:hypothetical protein